MTYELIPPTEDFFSYQWYDRLGFGTVMMTEDLFSRIDSTRRKLNKLEHKLRQQLGYNEGALVRNPENRDLFDCWNRVGWVRRYIGIWSCRDKYDETGWDAQMAYPHTKQVITEWPEDLFGERKEGNVLILLSPSTVNWLNAVERRLSDSSYWNVPYSVL